MSVVADTRVSIAGLGAIGRVIAKELDKGGIPGMKLGAVSALNKQKAQAFVGILANAVPVVELAQLGDYGDIVVECAPAALLAVVSR